jgi:uncharacterized protein YcfJ
MKMKNIVVATALSSILALPVSGQYVSQSEHERAKAEQKASDHRHHTGAKVVGGSAVGGAVLGGVMGGGKGALIGGAVGAGGGALANKAREKHDVKKRERAHEEYRDRDHEGSYDRR